MLTFTQELHLINDGSLQVYRVGVRQTPRWRIPRSMMMLISVSHTRGSELRLRTARRKLRPLIHLSQSLKVSTTRVHSAAITDYNDVGCVWVLQDRLWPTRLTGYLTVKVLIMQPWESEFKSRSVQCLVVSVNFSHPYPSSKTSLTHHEVEH